MEYPPLPSEIVVLPNVDVDDLWRRFLPFEALHHGMRICNPMTGADLDDLVTRLDPADGDRVLDIACGHGEALLRMAEWAAISGVGVDLSPWVLVRACAMQRERRLRGTVEWRLGNGADTPPLPEWDVVTCLGASWIWGGFAGTVQALADRCVPGGKIAVGDIQIRSDADRTDLDAIDEPALTQREQVAHLERTGLLPEAEMGLPRAAWEDYDARVRASAGAFAAGFEGDPERDFRAMAAGWDSDVHHRALAWTIWIVRKPD